jgi:NADH dehydrogenase
VSAAPEAAGHRLVIIGCGFGGLEAVRTACRDARLEVTLVERTNHHLFQPLLYQVATAGLSAPAISAPARHILRREMQRGRLTVLQAEATGFDLAARQVRLDDGSALPFDALIVAAGATHSYFGHDDWAAHAPGLKTLADAFDIRARVIGAFEQAERAVRAGDVAEGERWLTFAVVGAGPTGVELAGTLVEIARHTLPDEFRHIDSTRARVLLVEGSPRVLGSFEPALSESARRQLEALGVEVRTGTTVTAIDGRGLEVTTPGGAERIAARTVLWAAGVAASPLARALVHAYGAGIESLDRAGRVAVGPDLSLPGAPHVFAIGDMVQAVSEGRPVPGVSPAAKQMGRHAARMVIASLDGRPRTPFRYADHGSLATIGRRSAVVQLEVPWVGALRFSGLAAWLFWLFAHVYFLIGFRNRFVVLVDWAVGYLTFARHARVVPMPPAAVAASARTAPPGERPPSG